MAESPQTAPPAAKKNKHGLVVITTGDGKGKTTAALGLGLRAVGNDMNVCMVQFIKGKWKTGEQKALEIFGDRFEILPMGDGFTWDTKDREADMKRVREGWDLAMAKVAEGRISMLILDEILYVLSYDYFPLAELLDFLDNRPAGLHVVLTGRGAPPELIERADLVTEMGAVKHPYKAGIKAQKGIEF
ncbi:MAG: cob(I)yrinic acid a,c-diamide adenosyltransferase [Leptospirillia bacterium]